MTISARLVYHPLHFRFEAGTSRGVLRDKPTWYLLLSNGSATGIGECSLIPGLSIETPDSAEAELNRLVSRLNGLELDLPEQADLPAIASIVDGFVTQELPAIRFALETALLDLSNGGRRQLFPNAFADGKQALPINGLIWMNQPDHMLQQVQDKVAGGYTCIKLKIGAHNWDEERALLQRIRDTYGPGLTLRVDANGAFSPQQAEAVLQQLADLQVHSIEQPIKAGQPDVIAALCAGTPTPIALDEELIGVAPADRQGLLAQIKPQYIILKPSLHGGLTGAAHWIALAEAAGIGWWMTSALESNVGLNAIAQFTAQYPVTLPQGLGTGQLFTNNIESPLAAAAGYLSNQKERPWQLHDLLNIQ